MTFQSSRRARERVLTFGPQGVGKTIGVLEIARKAKHANFYVLDVDYNPSFELYLDGSFKDVADRFHVRAVDPDDWRALLDGIAWAKSLMGADDWLVIDSFSHAWKAVQDWYIESIYGKATDEYFMDIRKEKHKAGDKAKSLGALEGWMDWPVINNQFFPIYAKIATVPGHVYLTAESASLGDDEAGEIRSRFGPYGVKPVGQKKYGFWPHTVLFLTKSRTKEYALTTIKDRDRDEVKDEPMSNFANTWLVGLAKWRPEKMEEE